MLDPMWPAPELPRLWPGWLRWGGGGQNEEPGQAESSRELGCIETAVTGVGAEAKRMWVWSYGGRSGRPGARRKWERHAQGQA